MKDVQEVFNELQVAKKEMREIRKEYKDVLSQDAEYQEIVEKMTELRETKKQHELGAQRDMGNRWEKLEDLKGESKALQEMISDISLSTMMDGETVEVRDEYDALYEPIYSVAFRKVN
jgi:septal ring factor EnvC (AmiA/AmiB activator)